MDNLVTSERIMRDRRIVAFILMIVFCVALIIPLSAQASADRRFTNAGPIQNTGAVGPNRSGRMHTENSGVRTATIDFRLQSRVNNGAWTTRQSFTNQPPHTFQPRAWVERTSTTQWRAQAERHTSAAMSGRIFAQHAR